jgi:DnaK suppressor protein
MDEDAAQRVIRRRTTTVELLRAVDRDIARVVAASQLVSSDDEHDPEGSTIAFERAQTLAVADQLRSQLIELDKALARIESGTYGICEVCARPIAPARLEARPTATRCVICAAL